MFHRSPRPKDIVHNIICEKDIKVLFKNKAMWSCSPKQLGLPVSIILSLPLTLFFQADPLEHRGSLRSLICPGF